MGEKTSSDGTGTSVCASLLHMRQRTGGRVIINNTSVSTRLKPDQQTLAVHLFEDTTDQIRTD